MSHFTVLVIGENIDEQLLPYMQNCCQEPPKEYMEFHNVGEEYREGYQSGEETTNAVLMPDGKYKCAYNNEFKNPNHDPFDFGKDEKENPKYIYPSDPVEVSVNKVYTSFKSYIEDYCGYKFDEEEGAYGYWQNPKAKWDWYQIGGRWSGMLKLKPESVGEGETGRPGIMGSGYNVDDDAYGLLWVDSARKKDIDFEGMIRNSIERSKENWNKYTEEVDEILNNPKIDAEGRKNMISIRKYMYGIGEEESADEYARVKSPFSTFAVLKDGEWYEKGEMGWWACVSNEKDEGEWEEEFNKLLGDLDDNTLLTIVDCHI